MDHDKDYLIVVSSEEFKRRTAVAIALGFDIAYRFADDYPEEVQSYGGEEYLIQRSALLNESRDQINESGKLDISWRRLEEV